MSESIQNLKLASKELINDPLKVRVGARQQQVPAGEYLVKVENIKRGFFREKRPIFQFDFIVASGPHSGTTLRGFVNAHYESFSAYTKLYQWYSVVSGEEPELSSTMDLTIFYNKVLKVRVEEKQSHKTKNAFANVSTILSVHDII